MVIAPQAEAMTTELSRSGRDDGQRGERVGDEDEPVGGQADRAGRAGPQPEAGRREAADGGREPAPASTVRRCGRGRSAPIGDEPDHRTRATAQIGNTSPA